MESLTSNKPLKWEKHNPQQQRQEGEAKHHKVSVKPKAAFDYTRRS